VYTNGSSAQHTQVDSPVILHVPYIERPRPVPEAGPSNSQHYAASRRTSPPSDNGSVTRYSPYPASPVHTRLAAVREPAHSRSITLPSLQPRGEDDGESTTLPPISAMTRPAGGVHDDPMAILRRLQSDDGTSSRTSSTERSSHGRRPSVPEPTHRLPDASYGGGRVPSAHRLSRRSISPTPSAERAPPSRSNSTATAADRSPPANSGTASQLPPSLARSLLMPPPPSPRAHSAPRGLAEPQRTADRPYCGAAADDRPSVVEKRAWRPW